MWCGKWLDMYCTGKQSFPGIWTLISNHKKTANQYPKRKNLNKQNRFKMCTYEDCTTKPR